MQEERHVASASKHSVDRSILNGGNSFGLCCCAGTILAKGMDLTCLISTIGCCFCGSFIKYYCPTLFPGGYTASKVYTIVFFFTTILVAVILLTNEPSNSTIFEACSSDRCYGVQAVYRIAFTDFIFFLTLAIFTKLSVFAHIQYWILKIILWVGFCTGMFYVDNKPFLEWVYFARVASILWLFIQATALIEICFMANGYLMMRAEKEEDRIGPYKTLFLIISLLAFGGAITGNAFLYI